MRVESGVVETQVRSVSCVRLKVSCESTLRYSKFSCLRNREIETETLMFAPISLSYIEID